MRILPTKDAGELVVSPPICNEVISARVLVSEGRLFLDLLFLDAEEFVRQTAEFLSKFFKSCDSAPQFGGSASFDEVIEIRIQCYFDRGPNVVLAAAAQKGSFEEKGALYAIERIALRLERELGKRYVRSMYRNVGRVLAWEKPGRKIDAVTITIPPKYNELFS